MPNELLLIANPVAGGGTARSAAMHAAELFDRRGARVELAWTTRAGHATKLAEDAVRSGASRIVACGGDGTLNEVAEALVGGNTALGVIPAGRGNDFALALRLPADVRDAVNGIMMGRERQVDVGRVNERIFLTVAAVGFDGEVAQRVAGGAWSLLGRHAYIGGTLQVALRYRASQMTLRGDFGERSGRYMLVATGNTACYGGGIRIVPGAEPDDGVFDCCLVRDLSRFRLLRLLPSAFTGEHVQYPEVELVRTRTLEISAEPAAAIAADGEGAGRTPASLRVLPGALRILTPG
jgi:diacylglycerol kinase (ATP)